MDNVSSESIRRILALKPGSPFKHPLVGPGQEALIVELLRDLGVEVVPAVSRKDGQVAQLYVGKRGFMTFMLAMGGGNAQSVRRADAVVYLNQQGDLQIVAACANGHMYLDKDTKRRWRASCGHCTRCAIANTLALVKREYVRQQLAKKGLDTGTPTQHTTT